MADVGVISCPSCGASYPWKTQLAGKKVRCKCGELFAAVAPKALPAEPVEEPDVFALDEDSDYRAIPEPTQRITRMPAADIASTRTGATATLPPPPTNTGYPDVGAAYPTHGRRRVVVQEEDPSASKRKIVIPIAILILLVGGGIFAGLAMKGGMLGAKKPLLGDDAAIIEMIEDENGTEVKQWLKAHNRHMFLSMTEGQASAFADRLYAMGAVKVLAFGEVISRSVAVELPDDPIKRKQLFDFEKRHNGVRSKTKDVGQRYFLLWM